MQSQSAVDKQAGGRELTDLPEDLRISVARLFADSATDLKRVEQRIASCFRSTAPELTAISEYLLQLGGKRIRPILALSSGRLFGMSEISEDLVDAASGIELIHMATLLHDDIIDESATRRHKISPFKKFGLPPTLLAGDFLLARAFGLCAHLDIFVIEATEQASVELTEGEILEGTLAPGELRSMEQYLQVVARKTASLFALAATVGSYLAGAGEKNVALMREFGVNAGIAFQMVDDILDITADEDLLGKPSGTDLKQKTPSLINILWLLSGETKAREFFDLPAPTFAEAHEARNYLRSSPIVERARELAADYGARAKAALVEIEHPNMRPMAVRDLAALVDFTLERCM